MTVLHPKKSDLGVRTISAALMIAVAGLALWLGGWWWAVFVAVVAGGVFGEWGALVRGFEQRQAARILWLAAGAGYVTVAGSMLILLRRTEQGTDVLLAIVLAVIATDIGAYFAGRIIGGPKIAPKISPSKTWAGLGGGVVGASLVLFGEPSSLLAADIGARGGAALAAGAVVATIAQVGDFFESWMKRRAGVKDSGTLLPGHGGLFDRVDGLLAVLFFAGIALAAAGLASK